MGQCLKVRPSTPLGAWSSCLSLINHVLSKILAPPHLRGKPSIPNHHNNSKTSSFRCLLTWKSRLKGNAPSQIVIGGRRLSISRMSSANRRHRGSSTINSRLKSLPVRTPKPDEVSVLAFINELQVSPHVQASFEAQYHPDEWGPIPNSTLHPVGGGNEDFLKPLREAQWP